MKHLLITMILVLATITNATAQQAATTDELVTVPKKYVSTEGLQAAQVTKASEYIGIGKEIGSAIRESLEGVTDVANKFAGTPVGQFTLIMVAWKIIGKDLIGIPLFLMGIALWVWLFKRMFLGYWIKVYVDGKRESRHMDAYDFNSGDARGAAAVAFVVTLIVWAVCWITVIFT